MGEVGAEQPLCACYTECQEFKKIVEIKDTGLVVYCHTKRTEDVVQGEVIESAINTSQDVFILHNTKDVKITPSDLIPDLDKNDISCPRCRKIFERAQELLHKVTSIDEKNVLGVCDHCRKKAQSIKKPCNECAEVVKKFISTRGEQKEDTKRYIKIWLSKMGHLLKDAITPDKLKKARTRAYSELQIDRLYQYSPKSRREPEVKQMFSSETHKSDTNLHTEMNDVHLKEGHTVEKSVVFSQPVEPMETTFDATLYGEGIINRIIPGLDSLVESDATFVGPYVKERPKSKDSRGKPEQSLEYYDDSSKDVREAMKKKHDLSLRRMMKTEKESGTPYSLSHRPKIYEIPKVAPWEQQETQEKHEYYESEMDVKVATKKNHDLRSLDAKIATKRKPKMESRDLHPVSSHKAIKYETSRNLRESRRGKDRIPKNLDESVMITKGTTKRKFDLKHMMGLETETRDPSSEKYRAEKYDHGKIKKTTYDSEEIPKKVKKREDRYLADDELNLQRSVAKFSHEMKKPDQRMIKSKTISKKRIKADKITKNIPKQQFSFFFPKEKVSKLYILGASSSHLIKNTQEMLHQRAEEEKKRREEDRVKKHEEDEEKKTNAREEKTQIADETQKYVDEQPRHPEDRTHSENELEIKLRGGKESKIRVEEIRQDKSNQDGSIKDKEKSDSVPELEVKGKKDKESEDAKKDLKQKTESKDKLNKETKRAKIDWKEKHELKGRGDEITEKSKKDQKSKPELGDKIYEKSDKIEKYLKSKPEPRVDELSGKTRRDLKSKPEPKEKVDEVSEKAKKDFKSKPEPREKADEVSGKTQKDLKSKPELKEKIDDELERAKKDVKAKPKPKDKIDDLSEEAKKDTKAKSEPKQKIDGVLEKDKKYLKPKFESRDKVDEVSEKEKKHIKSKPEPKEKVDDVVEKNKTDIKSKNEPKEKKNEVSEKVKKDLRSKSEPKDKLDKESEKEKKSKTQDTDKDEVKAQKEREKQERHDQLQRNQEDKDRIKQLEQLRKEKESGSRKQQDALKEAEEPSKKKLGSIKDKEAPSKKTEESLKEKGMQSKKEESGKKKRKLSADIEEPLTKKQQSSKEAKELSKEQQEIPKTKQEPSKKERELSKDLKELSKKKRDSIKEKEGLTKGKEKISSTKEESKDEKSKVLDASKTAKGDGMDEAQFRKLQAELIKQKEENLKRKKQQEAEGQKARDLADKRGKEEGDRRAGVREAKAIIKPDPNRPLTDQSIKKEGTKPTKSDLKMNKIKIHNTSSDDLVLRLVRIKQTATGQWKTPRPCDIDPEVVKDHKCHHISGLTSFQCPLCNNSELEFDVESYDKKQNKKSEMAEIIIGEKIFKYKLPRLEKTKEQEVIPLLFQSVLQKESSQKEIVEIIPQETEPVMKPTMAILVPIKDTKGVDPVEPGKGIIRYALSDRTFIDKGWTMLPTEKVVRKMNVYRMRPAHPEFDWFEHNKNKRLMNYDTGEKLAEFDDNGRGRWYYRSGRLALDYYDAEETNAQQRFVIYSSGEPDERGRTHPITILATFDYLGNGIVFDHAGKIRLKYNQTEGVVLDRGIGPVSHWKWHTLNDPPVLQQVMIDTQMAHKDPDIIKLGTPADTKTRPDNEEMLAIEFDNFIKEKSKKLSQKFKPFQIKMKALKINEHFSLKVLDQATIYLIFRDGSTNLKLNIGMILDHQEIVDTDTAEVGEVSNNLERFPARTDSLAGLQRSIAYAQRYERQRTERERRLRPPEPCASADNLAAAASPPLRPPLRTMPTGSTSSAGYCNCRKPTKNVYYNTRLL